MIKPVASVVMGESHLSPHDTNESPSWLLVGQDGETESLLIGNAPALKALRQAIDQALEEGKGTIDVSESDFIGVQCTEVRPGTETSSWSRTDWPLYSCLGAIVSILALAGVGFWTLLKPLVSAF